MTTTTEAPFPGTMMPPEGTEDALVAFANKMGAPRLLHGSALGAWLDRRFETLVARMQKRIDERVVSTERTLRVRQDERLVAMRQQLVARIDAGLDRLREEQRAALDQIRREALAATATGLTARDQFEFERKARLTADARRNAAATSQPLAKFVVRLPEAIAAALRAESDRSGTAQAELVRRYVLAGLEGEPPARDHPAAITGDDVLVTITVRLPEAITTALRAESARVGMTQAELVRRYLAVRLAPIAIGSEEVL